MSVFVTTYRCGENFCIVSRQHRGVCHRGRVDKVVALNSRAQPRAWCFGQARSYRLSDSAYMEPVLGRNEAVSENGRCLEVYLGCM